MCSMLNGVLILVLGLLFYNIYALSQHSHVMDDNHDDFIQFIASASTSLHK